MIPCLFSRNIKLSFFFLFFFNLSQQRCLKECFNQLYLIKVQLANYFFLMLLVESQTACSELSENLFQMSCLQRILASRLELFSGLCLGFFTLRFFCLFGYFCYWGGVCNCFLFCFIFLETSYNMQLILPIAVRLYFKLFWEKYLCSN